MNWWHQILETKLMSLSETGEAMQKKDSEFGLYYFQGKSVFSNKIHIWETIMHLKWFHYLTVWTVTKVSINVEGGRSTEYSCNKKELSILHWILFLKVALKFFNNL